MWTVGGDDAVNVYVKYRVLSPMNGLLPPIVVGLIIVFMLPPEINPCSTLDTSMLLLFTVVLPDSPYMADTMVATPSMMHRRPSSKVMVNVLSFLGVPDKSNRASMEYHEVVVVVVIKIDFTRMDWI